jgi:hypothetical protein
MDESSRFVEEIEALEAVDGINQEVSLLEDGLMPGTSSLNWSAFMSSYLKGDSGFEELIGASPGTT